MGWFDNFGKAVGKSAVDAAKMTAVLTARDQLEQLRNQKLTPAQVRDIAKLRDVCNAILLNQAAV